MPVHPYFSFPVSSLVMVENEAAKVRCFRRSRGTVENFNEAHIAPISLDASLSGAETHLLCIRAVPCQTLPNYVGMTEVT